MSQKRLSKQRLPLEDKIYYAVVYTILVLLGLSVLYPLVYIVSASFSSPNAVSTGKVVLFPVELSIKGYSTVFANKRVWIGYKNTLIYTAFGTLINVFMTLICAYPMARKGLPHKGFFSFMFMLTMIFSGGMIPTYLLVRDLKMLDTRWSLVIPGAMAVYQMIITRTYIQSTIPDEMLESSQIDGCSDFRFFWKFIIPLSKAVIAVIAMQYAVGHWNSYFNAFI